MVIFCKFKHSKKRTKIKILLNFIISTTFLCPLFAQSGGGSANELLKNASIMIGLNQSFYRVDWKGFEEELKDEDLDLKLVDAQKNGSDLYSESAINLYDHFYE